MESTGQSKSKSSWNKGKKGKSDKGKSGSSKARVPRELPKKTFKVAVRKLPTESFGTENFRECLERLCTALSIDQSQVYVDHFVSGKLRQVLHF